MLRTAVLAGCLTLATASPAAAAIDEDYTACTGGDGFGGQLFTMEAPGSAYLGAKVFEDETWICIMAEGVGARIIVPVGSPVPVPDPRPVVSSVLGRVSYYGTRGVPCGRDEGNLIPGPHPLLTVGPTPDEISVPFLTVTNASVDFSVDAYMDDGELWVCYEGHGQPMNTSDRLVVRFG